MARKSVWDRLLTGKVLASNGSISLSDNAVAKWEKKVEADNVRKEKGETPPESKNKVIFH